MSETLRHDDHEGITLRNLKLRTDQYPDDPLLNEQATYLKGLVADWKDGTRDPADVVRALCQRWLDIGVTDEISPFSGIVLVEGASYFSIESGFDAAEAIRIQNELLELDAQRRWY